MLIKALHGIDDKITAIYARDLTVREIEGPALLSSGTDEVLAEATDVLRLRPNRHLPPGPPSTQAHGTQPVDAPGAMAFEVAPEAMMPSGDRPLRPRDG